MAPFKLKFRMGSSRSTSQEVDTDPQVNQSLLNNSNVGIGASNSTIDSVDYNSIGSLSNDQRSLLRNCNSNERIGYLNPTLTQSIDSSIIPSSPPPSYEHVLGENRLANLDRDSNQTPTRQNRDTCGSVRSLWSSSVEHLNNTCTDPDCTIVDDNNQTIDGTRRESIGSREFLVSTMTTPSSHDNLLECTCDPLFMSQSQEQINCGERERLQLDGNEQPQQQTSSQHQQQHHQQQQQQNQLQDSQQEQDNQDEQCMSSGEDDNYSDGDWSQQASNSMPQNITTTEIISNKSSKEIYKAVAKQWGITCKMSDQCRCMECQSHYFDCEFDENELQKTDGGLGAGTPMFISEVMHGTACTIL